MKKLIVSLFTLVFGAGILADDVEAPRLRGGRGLGAQRQGPVRPRQAPPPTQPQPARAPQPSGRGRWFAPLAGLAAGLGLGWLFAQGGFGAVASALLMALLAGAVVFALMRVLSKQRGPQAQYAGFGNETVAAPPPSQLPGDAGVQPNYRSQFVSNIPAGFDVEAFFKEAQRNFQRLQQANDRGDLARLRQATTGDMLNTPKDDVVGPSGGPQTHVRTPNP